MTTETSYDTPRAGEYKGSNDGFAIASVTAPALANDVVPLASTAARDPDQPDAHRQVQLRRRPARRRDRRHAAADRERRHQPAACSARTRSSAAPLCVNFEVNGNCANPPIATNGPLYGQDGVRVTAGSSVNVIDTLLTQNLVQGTGAPIRGAATNNANLSRPRACA